MTGYLVALGLMAFLLLLIISGQRSNRRHQRFMQEWRHSEPRLDEWHRRHEQARNGSEERQP